MRTARLRLGTAVIVLPWHNPVLLAEEAATLDQISGGRFDFGVGKGYRHSEFHGFRIAPEEAQARFDESIAVMVHAWTTRERFSVHSQSATCAGCTWRGARISGTRASIPSCRRSARMRRRNSRISAATSRS